MKTNRSSCSFALLAALILGACGGEAPSAPAKTAKAPAQGANAAPNTKGAKVERGAAAHRVTEGQKTEFEPVPAEPETRPMGEVLAEVHAVGRDRIFFFSDAPVRELEVRLTSTGAPADHATAYDRFMLGSHQLRIGHTRDAIENLTLALEALAKLPPPPPEVKRPERFADYVEKIPGKEAAYELGLAYLRLGENDNCVCERGGDSCIFPIAGSGIHQHEEGSLGAIKYFTEVLDAYPDNLTSRWLLNVAYMTLGEWPGEVPERWLHPARRPSRPRRPSRASTTSPRACGLGAMRTSPAASCADDFDGDGRLDVWSPRLGHRRPAALLAPGRRRQLRGAHRGGRPGRASTAASTSTTPTTTTTATSTSSSCAAPGCARHGRHPQVAAAERRARAVHRRDLRRGPRRQVYYPTQTARRRRLRQRRRPRPLRRQRVEDDHARSPAELFRNNGDGTFTDVAAAAGVANDRFAKGVAWGDYDNDGWPDLYVSNFEAREPALPQPRRRHVRATSRRRPA